MSNKTVITDNLNINNIDDNFTYILKELSELTLSGGQAQGKFENLLNTFIKGTIIEKAPGDVNIKIDNKNTIINENEIQYIKRDGMKLVFHTPTRNYETN